MPDALQMVQERGNLAGLAKALRAEDDRKTLRRDLTRSLRAAVEPAREAAKSAVLQMDSGGLPHEGEPLRVAIARKVVTEVRLGGKATGVNIKAKRKGMPRGFEHAPKRTQRAGGWRVNPRGSGTWIVQEGRVHWFDDAMITAHRPAFDAVRQAMEDMARRIVERSK